MPGTRQNAAHVDGCTHAIACTKRSHQYDIQIRTPRTAIGFWHRALMQEGARAKELLGVRDTLGCAACVCRVIITIRPCIVECARHGDDCGYAHTHARNARTCVCVCVRGTRCAGSRERKAEQSHNINIYDAHTLLSMRGCGLGMHVHCGCLKNARGEKCHPS